MNRNTIAFLAPITLPVLLASGAGELHAAKDSLPAGVEQILPRGSIAAVFDPKFVPAAQADIADDAWILGVVVEGRAHAYSLNLLNAHEVVNDKIGDKSFAAVW